MRIRLPKVFAIALSGMALLFGAGASAQDAAHTEHAAHAQSAQATLPTGQRWATDAPLRDGMRRIRQAVEALGHAEHGHLDSAQMANVAKLIDTAVQDMIANCKLKPDADAALHGLLAKFIAGAQAARSGQGVPAALADMRGALARYPQLFDDPDWNASTP
ncbi:MAG: DnrO protein [Proteobacteria bacterium]|nr:DnrO protein [Pseudomonadota bacterium]